MSKTKLMQGDNMLSLKKLPDNSIDSVVTDGPYGLSFMNKKWDYDVPSVEFWREVYRVLKPGGHVLSFGGTRTYHRMTVNIEDAGFEIRDQIMWLYGSGFPKSHNIGKSVDKLNGVKGDKGPLKRGGEALTYDSSEYGDIGWRADKRDPNTYIAKNEWEGWGTALKPANEPICVARKPLSEKTVAANVLKWGTGGINIDGCRVGTDKVVINTKDTKGGLYSQIEGARVDNSYHEQEGRFPANIILDEEAGMALDEQSGISDYTKKKDGNPGGKTFGGSDMKATEGYWPKDKGGASRFFYCPKVSKKERNAGCDELEEKQSISQQVVDAGGTGAIGNTNPTCKTCKGSKFNRGNGICSCMEPDWKEAKNNSVKNNHPTVKPISLMAYLCRLVTPPNGICLDPFMGSGSTGCAAVGEGFRFVGMEMDEDYFEIATKRINHYGKEEGTKV